jgi:hypothetical protein
LSALTLRRAVRTEREDGARLRPRTVVFVPVSARETHYISDIARQIGFAPINPIGPSMFRRAQCQGMGDCHLLYRLSLVSPRLFPGRSLPRHADYHW